MSIVSNNIILRSAGTRICLMVIPVLIHMALLKYMPMYCLRASFYDSCSACSPA